jgi:hypothetical protein
MSNCEYDIGYFEGIRNAMVAFRQDANAGDCVFFMDWLQRELEDANRLRYGE